MGKSSKQSKIKAESRRKSSRSKLLRFVILPVVALAVVLWFWEEISSWFAGIAFGTATVLGWGALFIIIALAILVVLLALQKQSSLIHHWNRWLGVVVFMFAVWAIMAWQRVGGSFGFSLIGGYNVVGVFRVAGLIIAGFILFAPRASWRVAKWLISRIKKWLKRRGASGLSLVQKPKLPAPGGAPGSYASAPEKDTISSAVALARQSKEELRQVAEEVWKKYGQSSSLVTVDGWRLPPVDILDITPEAEFSEADNLQRAKLIEEALSSYGVEGKVVQINAGPTVTQFGVEPGWDRKMREVRERDGEGNVRVRMEEVSKTRVKVDRIMNLSNDLALSLAAPSIRIEAPVPGKSIVGIEVPNTISSSVSLRGVIETSTFQKTEARSKLTIALGKSAGGEAVTADLAKMPHLLVAGATGSGKTVCLNTIISCLLLHNAPCEAKFIMIDPKRVELTPYNSIPHLISPVIVDANKAVGALRWLGREMDRRYEKFAAASARNIEGFNKDKQETEKLPYLVVIIDELADLMMAGFDEVEQLICRLAQLSRATGIHLVVATQRPSVDVVTGLIKANFPTRISFAVTSQVDSRTILDMVGAEKLLGRGDMLFMPTESAKPKRLQGCFVSDAEIERLVYFWNSQKKEETALRVDDIVLPPPGVKKEEHPLDSLMEEARQLVIAHKHVSTSFLQRKLRIGYPRAARIMEQLEDEMGITAEREGEGEDLS